MQTNSKESNLPVTSLHRSLQLTETGQVMDMAIDFRKRDQGEFFLTFDEFYSLFNKCSVIFDLAKNNYQRKVITHQFTRENCRGIKLKPEEDSELALNVQYILTVNKKTQSNAHVILNLQQEDGRLKATGQTYDPEYRQLKKPLYLGVFKLPGGSNKLTSLSQAKPHCISYECMPAWIVGANLEKLENGTYVILPTFYERIANKDTFKYFLTITTNLSEEEFKLEGPGKDLHELGALQTGNLSANKEFIKNSSKLFTSKMIHTTQAIYNNKVRKGFLDMAAFKAMQTNFIDDEIEKQHIVTPRSIGPN